MEQIWIANIIAIVLIDKNKYLSKKLDFGAITAPPPPTKKPLVGKKSGRKRRKQDEGQKELSRKGPFVVPKKLTTGKIRFE